MKKYCLWLMTFLLASTTGFAQTEATTKDGKKIWLYENGTWTYANQPNNLKSAIFGKIEIPKSQANETIIEHLGYTLSYNEKYVQANWVAYELTKAETNKIVDREDQFKPDPKVKTLSAAAKDYLKSGYDKGHLAPAADMGWDATAMAESFFYSNMSPQKPGFNRGIWKKLEEQVRNWAIENEAVYVVTVPVLTPGLKTIGIDKVTVPNYFCKVVLDYTSPGIKGIGFIMPNESSTEPLQRYAVSIDSVEKFTGIDFFPSLPDDQEKALESTLDLKAWQWTSSASANKVEVPIPNVPPVVSIPIPVRTKKPVLVQCIAITKSGMRCKNQTGNLNKRCYLHQQP